MDRPKDVCVHSNSAKSTPHYLVVLNERDYIPITLSMCTIHSTSVSSDNKLNEIMQCACVHSIVPSDVIILLKNIIVLCVAVALYCPNSC